MSRSIKIISSITLCILMSVANDGWGGDRPATINGFSPKAGSPGDHVIISGKGFGRDPRALEVALGGMLCKVVSVKDNEVIIEVPANGKTGPIQVKTGKYISKPTPKSFKMNTSDAFTSPVASASAQQPVITGFKPMKGPPGTQVKIRGKNFGTDPNSIRVVFNGRPVSVSNLTPTSLSITVPGGAKSGKLEIQTKGRGSALSAQNFQVPAQVQIAGFVPSAGTLGQTVTIFGRDFHAKPARNKVTLAGTKVKVLEASNTTLKVKVPSNATSGKFSIEVPNQGSSESTDVFNVVEEIKITDFEPKTGVPGMYVGIQGKGFKNNGLRAFLGNTPLGVRVDSDTKALVAIPMGSTDGPFVLKVPGGISAKSNQNFKVELPVSVRSFMPPAAPVGSRVSIYGTGFILGKGQTEVILGGKQVPIQAGSTSNMLAVLIPEGAKSGPFVVKVKGKGEANTPTAFSVIAPRQSTISKPTVTTTPDANPAPAAKAQLEPSILPEDQKAVSMDSLLGIGEGGGEGSGEIVDEGGGEGAKATITSIEPLEGPVGETITVNGSGFGEDPEKIRAWLGEKRADVVGVVPDMLMIEVPKGVEGGNVRIKVGDGLTIGSKKTFKVTATD